MKESFDKLLQVGFFSKSHPISIIFDALFFIQKSVDDFTHQHHNLHSLDC